MPGAVGERARYVWPCSLLHAPRRGHIVFVFNLWDFIVFNVFRYLEYKVWQASGIDNVKLSIKKLSVPLRQKRAAVAWCYGSCCRHVLHRSKSMDEGRDAIDGIR